MNLQMKHILSTLITLTLLMGSSAALATKLYKWKDDKGRIHYGQTKPTEFKFEVVDAPPPPPANAPDLNAPFAEQIRGKSTGSTGGTSTETTEASGDASNPDDKKAQCAKAKNNLSQLKSQARVKVKNADGSFGLLSEEDKQAKIKEAQKQIDYFCK